MLKIFLCDLSHETVTVSIDTMPVGIGYIASYAKQKIKHKLDIQLIKSPHILLNELNNKPDVIGFSNYCWNSSLSHYFAEYAKSLYPDVITVMGGPNFPKERTRQEAFLKNHLGIDFYVFEEGEVGFVNILNKCIDESLNIDNCKIGLIPGVLYYSSILNSMIHGGILDRIKDLDIIPSPYLTNIMDKFFGKNLNPTIQTNRGCPFGCTFCHEGDRDYFKKVNSFSTQRIVDELDYIASKITNESILGITDSNFLMYDRDQIICEKIRSMQDEISYPKTVNVTTGKNRQERVLNGMRTLKYGSLSMTASVQSMSSGVLGNIKRKNIDYMDYIDIQNKIHEIDPSYITMSEMIIPLPGETKESFFYGVRQLIDSGIDLILPYTLMMLEGTELNNEFTRSHYKYETKYRVIPRSFSEFNNSKVFEVEEVGISTKDMSFDDYVECRMFALFIVISYNNRVFDALFKYIRSLSLDPFDFIECGFDSIKNNSVLFSIFEEFRNETIGELYDSEEQITDYYSDDINYNKLYSGKEGGNLLQRFWVKLYVYNYTELVDFIFDTYEKILIERINTSRDIHSELVDLKAYLLAKRKDVYISDHLYSDLNMAHDVVSWFNNANSSVQLCDYITDGIRYSAILEHDKSLQLEGLYLQYGKNEQSIGKISTRLHVSNFYRDFKIIAK
jgi:radical SAM superfamily enzyme YgiQ (UPF0313 family)